MARRIYFGEIGDGTAVFLIALFGSLDKGRPSLIALEKASTLGPYAI